MVITQFLDTNSFRLATDVLGDTDAVRLAVVLPGRLDTKDYVHVHSLIQLLASRNYLAVAFDPPGTWNSPGSIDIFTTTNYLQAVNEVIDHYGNRPTVLLGHSRGGTVAVHVGASNPAVIGI